MPQHVADLVERGTFAQHVSCEAVASRCEPTYFCGGRRPVPSNASQHRIEDLGIAERPVGRPCWRRTASRDRPRRPFLDVVDDGLADIVRERHPVVPLALARIRIVAGAPVDVVELDCDRPRAPRRPSRAIRAAWHSCAGRPEFGRSADQLFRPPRVSDSAAGWLWPVGRRAGSNARSRFVLPAPEQEPE